VPQSTPGHTAVPLTTPLKTVRGIGPSRAAALQELGVRNVGQLLAHLPARHERLEAESPVAALAVGAVGSARGLVTATRTVTRRPRPRFEAVLIDDSGRLDLVFFNALYMRDRIQPGVRLRVQGRVQRYGPGLRMSNPQVEVLPDEPHEQPQSRDARLRPVYPASERITSAQIERCVRTVLPSADLIDDHLPADFRTARHLPDLATAYRLIHDPPDEEHAASARRRLAFDELFLLQTGLALKRAQRLGTRRAPALRWSPAIDRAIRDRLPFTLTPAQDRAVQQIAEDLSRPEPANRLIQGDVGSGKTLVALYAMLQAAASGAQAALMAPTELLAEQHARSIGTLLKNSAVRSALLTGSVPDAERAVILAALERGDIDLLIGTHALLTDAVRFHTLGVAVIDEQHRFGVHQRAALRAKGDDRDSAAHTLVMTATPIPRTLALTLFGDLDVSTIDQLPPGRSPVTTRVLPPERRDEVYAFVRARIDRGEQAYIVAPAIEGDDDARGLLISSPRPPPPPTSHQPAAPPALRSVIDLERELAAGPLRGKRLGVLHGRMKPADRERVMDDFRAGRIDALVSTTIIEVGVDVPNATVMVIEDADRFGLAQLHQLRGRVGRGPRKSACLLIARPLTDDAAARLKVIASTTDGFRLAEKDLEIRGFGDVIGLRQSGMPPFRVADLTTDLDLLTLARRDALAWVERSPALDRPEDALLRRRLLKAHGTWLNLGDVA
jgi:ATP-dependent DNA helicase RecG